VRSLAHKKVNFEAYLLIFADAEIGHEPARAFALFKPERIDDGHVDALKKLVADIRQASAGTTIR
jgi:hypothetical protein